MFSLRETESAKFIYRCHGSASERELTATDRVAGGEAAVACNETYKCATELPPTSDTKSPKAS